MFRSAVMEPLYIVCLLVYLLRIIIDWDQVKDTSLFKMKNTSVNRSSLYLIQLDLILSKLQLLNPNYDYSKYI